MTRFGHQICRCCNYIESLLGIETIFSLRNLDLVFSCNYIESLLGIETSENRSIALAAYGCNYIESLLGIETGISDKKQQTIESLLQLY